MVLVCGAQERWDAPGSGPDPGAPHFSRAPHGRTTFQRRVHLLSFGTEVVPKKLWGSPPSNEKTLRWCCERCSPRQTLKQNLEVFRKLVFRELEFKCLAHRRGGSDRTVTITKSQTHVQHLSREHQLVKTQSRKDSSAHTQNVRKRSRALFRAHPFPFGPSSRKHFFSKFWQQECVMSSTARCADGPNVQTMHHWKL